jgi:hypothetical protein
MRPSRSVSSAGQLLRHLRVGRDDPAVFDLVVGDYGAPSIPALTDLRPGAERHLSSMRWLKLTGGGTSVVIARNSRL